MKTTITITILVFSILAFNITKLSAQSEILGHTYLGSFSGHSYYISNCSTTWYQANEVATLIGGYLATISDANENNFLTPLVPAVGDYVLYPELGGTWIGLVANECNEWVWSNGEPVTFYDWQNYFTPEPNWQCGAVSIGCISGNCINYPFGTWLTSHLTDVKPYLLEFSGDPGCNNPNKSYICHNGNTICVNNDAVQAHLNHGDYAGPCGPCNSSSLTMDPKDISPDEGHSLIEQVSVKDVTNYQDLFSDQDSAQEFKIFPNPTTGLTTIQLPQPIKTGTLIIRTITGKEISIIPFSQASHLEVDLASLVSGMYLIELRTQHTFWQNIVIKI